MTEREALKLALEALDAMANEGWLLCGPEGLDNTQTKCVKAIAAIKEALAQSEQEPVAMKFKIYKPTVPDPTRQGINNALLPWVYDQDRNSGFDATMWVTPVSTLPPQRKPLTDEQRDAIARQAAENDWHDYKVIDAVEAAHGIKGEA